MTGAQLKRLWATAVPDPKRFSWFPTQMWPPLFPEMIPLVVYEHLVPPPDRADGLPLGYPDAQAACLALARAIVKYSETQR